jgi:beta-lactamase regulating signal transducer with metallopeptidase domain
MPGLYTIATWDGAEWLVAWFDIALRGALLLGAAALLVATLRRASAATRHLVLTVALLGLVLLPILTWTLPSWRAPLPQRAAALLSRLAVTTLPAEPSPSELVATPARSAAVEPASQSQSQTQTQPVALSPPEDPGRQPLARRATATPDEAVAALGSRLETSSGRGPWFGWILPLWGVGALLAAAWFALQHGSVRYLASRAQPETDAAILQRVERARSQVGIRRGVRVLRGAVSDTPMTWGFTRAVLLLPHGMPQWPEARQRDVLLHELAHIKRRDHLTQLLAQLACTLHWFNPLAWYAARRMVLEREHACDDFVLNAGVRASDYAQHLLDVAAWA